MVSGPVGRTADRSPETALGSPCQGAGPGVPALGVEPINPEIEGDAGLNEGAAGSGRIPASDAAEAPSAAGAWFGVLWAASILFHLAANDGHLLRLDHIGVLQLGLVAGSSVMVIRPSARVALALAGLYLLVLWLKLPVVGNHEVILGLVSAVMILSALRAMIGPEWRSTGGRRPAVGLGPGTGQPGAPKLDWPAEAAPAARWVLIVSYGFIAVSKLNAGFFDLADSCALLFTEALGMAVGVGPTAVEAAGPAAMVATAGIELAIPMLLLVRGFRTVGVVVALGFHFVLALDPASHVWDFSSVLLPLFLLFMPDEFHRRIDRVVGRLTGRSAGVAALTLAIVVTGHAVVASGATALPTWAVAYPLWLTVGGFTLVAAGRFAVAEHRHRNADLRWRVAGVVVPIIGLTALIGLGPYLEYRTAAAFNMYSNLQVLDGESNHFLIGSLVPGSRRPNPAREPSVLEVVSAAEESPLQHYIEHGLALPTENLKRYLADHPEDPVVVRRAGEPVSATEAGLRPAAEPAGWWPSLQSHLRHKLAFRRAVDLSPPRQCLRSWGPIG